MCAESLSSDHVVAVEAAESNCRVEAGASFWRTHVCEICDADDDRDVLQARAMFHQWSARLTADMALTSRLALSPRI